MEKYLDEEYEPDTNDDIQEQLGDDILDAYDDMVETLS